MNTIISKRLREIIRNTPKTLSASAAQSLFPNSPQTLAQLPSAVNDKAVIKWMSEQWQLRAGGLEDVCFRSGTQLSVQHRLPPASLLPSQCVRMVCVAPPAAAESTWQADCGTAPPLHDNDRNQVTAKLMARHSHSHRQSELTMDSWPMKMSWSECLVLKQPGGLLVKCLEKIH